MIKIQLLLFFLYSLFLSHSQLAYKKIEQLPKKMNETSGLVCLDDRLITHNDGGNDPHLFVLSLKGKHLKTIKVNNVKNNDWEDLALDDKDNLYIGDFGNNFNNRKNLKIHIVKKGFLDEDEVSASTINFTYEDQKKFPPKEKNLQYDCEAFIWKNDKLFLFTKCRTKPFDGRSKIYMLPAKPGNFEAKLIGQFQFCNKNWMTCSVTSADYHPKSKTLSILAYSRLYIIRNFKFNIFWKGDIKVYKIPKTKQREAICFYKKNTWFMTDEFRRGINGGNLYTLKLKKK